MSINPPKWFRAAAYIANIIGTPVVVYLLAKGWIGNVEMALWGAEVTATATLAALNVPSTASHNYATATAESRKSLEVAGAQLKAMSTTASETGAAVRNAINAAPKRKPPKDTPPTT